jgi:glycosyltransferase involved in cell wall biosynthesis
MEPRIIERAAELGISRNVLFAGFLKGEEINKAYQMADLYVMPSVSEPFGITPLEAMRNGTPVLISKQSGVSEVIHHCLKTDFWDVNDIAGKILAVLHYRTLSHTLKEHGSIEVKKFNWDIPAQKCIAAYNECLNKLVH